jgi:hypothetical protein
MTRLFLCLVLSAYTASLITPFEWERNVRREWHEVASYYRDLESLSSTAH